MNENFYSDLRNPSIIDFEKWLSERLKTNTNDQRLVFNTMICLEYITMSPKSDALAGIILGMVKEWCKTADNNVEWEGKYVTMISYLPGSGLMPKYAVYENGEFKRLELETSDRIH